MDSGHNSRQIAILTSFFRRVVLPIRVRADTKRRSIVRELVQTERNYVDSLLICEEVYYKPLDRSITSKSPLIDPATLGELFGNLDQIRSLHQSILRTMDEVAGRLKSPFPPHETYIRIASPFAELVPRMQQLYTTYLATNEHSEEILRRLKKNKKFQQFLSQSLFNPRAKCQEIEDLLILPTQRVAGYKLLFERVLKYFPTQTFATAQQAYQQALDALLGLGALMNEEKSDTGSQDKLLTIAETLWKIPPGMCILKPGRKMLGVVKTHTVEDEAKKRGKECCIYVTSDILILAVKADGKRWQYIDAVPIVQIRCAPSSVDELLDRAFILQTHTKNYHYVMKTTKARDDFIDGIKSMKKRISQVVAKQTQDGAEYMQGLLSELTRCYTEPKPPRSRAEVLQSLR
jgi:hypothetical protein